MPDTAYLRDFTPDERKQLAKEGKALPDGSYPIVTVADLDNAIQAFGRSGGDPKVKAHIIKRARALGATDHLPKTWQSNMAGEPLVTIPDVEILKVGNWHSGLSGRVPVTDDDIDAMLEAARDPEIDAGPLKIGHIDPRFDGEPALGWLSNLRKRADGTLLADIVDAPAKMETLIRSAFRRRSAEIAWGVRTPSGRTYKAALAGLALLGVTPPAVKGLADVVSRYSAPAADAVDRVVIVDGDDGELAELHAAAISAQAAFEARAAFLSAGSANGDGPNLDHPTDGQNTGGLVTDDQVREALGLPAEVPVTDQLRQLAERAQTPAPAQPAQPAPAQPAETAPAAPAQPAAAQTDTAPATEPPAGGQLSAPTVAVDSAALAALQADAQAGREAKRILDEQERERELAAALSGGKIAPANLELWRAAWNGDKAQTRALLAGLPQVFTTVDTQAALSGRPAGDAAGAIPEPLAAELDQLDRDLKTFMTRSR